jgi:hypothetical protein
VHPPLHPHASDLPGFVIDFAGTAGQKRARTSAMQGVAQPIKPIEEPVVDDTSPSEEDAAATLIFLSRSFAQDRRAEPEKKVSLPPLNQHLFGHNVSPPQPGEIQYAANSIMTHLTRFHGSCIAIFRRMNLVGQESYKHVFGFEYFQARLHLSTA